MIGGVHVTDTKRNKISPFEINLCGAAVIYKLRNYSLADGQGDILLTVESVARKKVCSTSCLYSSRPTVEGIKEARVRC